MDIVMFIVEYVAPYTQRLIQRTFPDWESANATAAFNRSCGVKTTVRDASGRTRSR